MADPDIWWHLRNAEYLVQTGSLPNQDMFSFTLAGQPWMNHEWLAELPFYAAWRAGGLPGIEALMIVLAEAVFLSLLYLCYRSSGNIKSAVVACLVWSFLAAVNFGPRMILFGYLWLTLMLIVLERYRSRGSSPLWTLPLLFALWANTHGSWLIGLIVFGIVVSDGFVRGRWGQIESNNWTPYQRKRLVATGLASVAALFLNPFGWRLVTYPFEFASAQTLNVARVTEWASLDFHDGRGKLTLIIIAVSLLIALARNYRWALHEVELTLFGMYLGLTYIRFLFLFAVLSAPTLSRILTFVPDYDERIDKPTMNAVVILAIGGLLAAFAPLAAPATHEEIVARDFPAGALRYMEEHPVADRLFNYYSWGGYLGWRDRKLKVFIDSRMDIFEYGGIFQDYLDVSDIKDPETILDKYEIGSVLFPASHRLTYLLSHTAGWKQVYRDDVSALFERSR